MTLSALRCPSLSCRTSPPQGGRLAVIDAGAHPGSLEIGENRAAVQSPPLRGRCPAGQRGATWSALLAILALLFSAFALTAPAHADDAALRTIIAKFATAKGFPAIEAVVRELGATGDPAVGRPLTPVSKANLGIRKSDSQVFVAKHAGATVSLLDPVSGEPA